MTNLTDIKTLGALKQSAYQSKDLKTELRENLIDALRNNKEVFTGPTETKKDFNGL